MIDLETMGQKGNAAIIAIGAVYFDNNGLGDEFYVLVDIQSCVDIGMEIDASTVMWWMKQSDEARSAFSDKSSSIFLALDHLREFMGSSSVLWGNGSDFDNVILANAYDKLNQQLPWKFWNSRCYRTMKNMFKDVKMVREGVHHNALSDAITQAKHLVKIVNEKGIKL